MAETGKPARKGFGAKKAAAKKVIAKKAPAVKKGTADAKPAKKTVKKTAAKKTVKKAAAKKVAAKKAYVSPHPEPAKPLLTASSGEIGKKRIIKKPARDEAPF